MDILVCVKQVPDSDAPIEMDETGRWFRPKRRDAYRMNRFDECAVEEALRIKSQFPDTRVDAVSMGPRQVVLALKRAVGMGADRAVYLKTDHAQYESPWRVARAIARYAEGKGYTLILTGLMGEDDMQGQVGPALGELLSMPCATGVVSQTLDVEAGTVLVEREIEGGDRHCLELVLPAVLTVQTGINRPRYPSLSHMLRFNEEEMEAVHVEARAYKGPGERIERVSRPQRSKHCNVLEGTSEEKAHRLVEILQEKSFI